MTARKISQLPALPVQKALLCLPSAVSSLRLVALPLLTLSLSVGQVSLGAFFFLFAVASDIADGRLARRLGVSSKFGAWFDASVDFIFITGTFAYFTLDGLYPPWILALIIFMFAQFIVTSRLSRVIYDPIGKYYGGFLYGAIGLTILLPEQILTSALAVLLAIITGVSLASRLLHLLKGRKKHSPTISK